MDELLPGAVLALALRRGGRQETVINLFSYDKAAALRSNDPSDHMPRARI